MILHRGLLPVLLATVLGLCVGGLNAPAFAGGGHHHCASQVDERYTTAQYTSDDFHAEVKYSGPELCDGVSKTVSLNSYQTQGSTWPKSGNQSFVDHQQFTVDKYHTAGTLAVKRPDCYYQTDLYWGSTRYDGKDGALPHYPDTPTPYDLIAARNGGSGCTPPSTPATPTVKAEADGCVNPGEQTGLVVATVTNTDDATTDQSVTYRVMLNGQTEQVKLDDGRSGSVRFTGVAPGDYTVVVKGDDGTSTSTTVTVKECSVPPTTDACPDLPDDQPGGFQCEPKTEKQTRSIEKGPNCKTGVSRSKVQERTRTQRFVNGQWSWGQWSKWKTVKATSNTVPPGACKATIRAHCVTRHWGEGTVMLFNKGLTVPKRFHIERSGKDRVVTVGAGKNKRVNLTGLRVGSTVKVKADEAVLARDKVEGGCGGTTPPHTGQRAASG